MSSTSKSLSPTNRRHTVNITMPVSKTAPQPTLSQSIEEAEPDDINLESRLDITSVDTVDLSELNDNLLRFLADETVASDLLKGVDLTRYAADIDNQIAQVQRESVESHAKEAERLLRLYNDLDGFDNTLGKMQEILAGFQKHLGSISTDIKSLQSKSLVMNAKVKNRKNVQKKTSKFVEGVVLAPELVVGIKEMDLETNAEKYSALLSALSGKKSFCETPPYGNTPAAREVLPVVTNLCVVASGRIREFILKQIYALQTPKTNIQIKQSILRKHKFFIEFLLEHDGRTANEIRGAYIDVLSRIYVNLFRKHIAELQKVLAPEHTDKYDLLGVDIKETGGIFQAKKTEGKVLQVFRLGNRGNVLSLNEAKPVAVVAAVNAAAGKPVKKIFFEEFFAGLIKLLVDSSVGEYAFVVDFFAGKREIFGLVFQKTIIALFEAVNVYVENTYDSTALLLMIRLLQENQKVLTAHRVAGLDHTFDKLNTLFWKRLELVLDLNINSFDSTPVSYAERQTLFFLVRRYAEFDVVLTHLNRDHNDELIITRINKLRTIAEKHIVHVASGFQVVGDQRVFLIKCYDLIVRVFASKTLVSPDTIHFEKLLSEQVEAYVELILSESRSFARVLQFVKANEALKPNEQPPTGAEAIVREFKASWKAAMDQMEHTISGHFNLAAPSGYSIAMDDGKDVNLTLDAVFEVHFDAAYDSPGSTTEILKKLLTRFLEYYTKFTKIVQGDKRLSPNVLTDLVQKQTIIVEMKKFRKDR